MRSKYEWFEGLLLIASLIAGYALTWMYVIPGIANDTSLLGQVLIEIELGFIFGASFFIVGMPITNAACSVFEKLRGRMYGA